MNDLPPRPLRWLFLDLNSYFASVEQQERPELRGRPVAVGPTSYDTGIIIACSYEAKAKGVRTLMQVREARALCPDLVVVDGRHSLYVETHHRIVAEVERHVPVTRVCSIDEVACRLLDNENAPEQAISLAHRIKAGIRNEVGEWLRCSIGIAPNRLLAKLASDMQKPDGLVMLRGDELPHRLYPLKLTDIAGIGPNMEKRLAKAGINDIPALCARRPRDAGEAWGGRDGDRLWYLLHGFELPEKPTQSRSIGHSHVLSPRQRDAGHARLVARRLALKAGERLRAKGYTARLLTLDIRFEPATYPGVGEKWHAGHKLPATADSFAIVHALDVLWMRMRAGHPGPLRLKKVGLALSELAPADAEQGSLFARLDATHELARATRTTALSHALDKINGRFGKNSATLGPLTGGRADRVGGSIAFNRIPEL